MGACRIRVSARQEKGRLPGTIRVLYKVGPACALTTALTSVNICTCQVRREKQDPRQASVAVARERRSVNRQHCT